MKFKHLFNLVFLVVLLLIESELYSQKALSPGIKYTINDNWKFYPGGFSFAQRSHQKGFPLPIDDLWETVSIPHTWNAFDPFDDAEGYRRGIGWYRKFIKLDSTFVGKTIYLKFEGANQTTDVYINGAFVGQHKGGYNQFTFDITKFVEFDKNNLVAVKVDNSHDNTITPLSIGFALYGGIYRDVWLIAKSPVHFNKTHYSSSGVYISTPEVSNEKASVKIRCMVENKSAINQKAKITHIVVDKAGETILTMSKKFQLKSGKSDEINDFEGIVDNPKLWSPETPNLYKVISTIEVDGKTVDQLENPLGFRWFSIDPQNGLTLNGKKYVIKGTNRHQDFDGLGSALSNTQHIKDLEWIKNMGANFVRLAHYPQDPVVLQTADRLGLLAWVELPNVNYIVPSKEITQTSKERIKEMVFQNYNHPSVIFWGSSNELFLWDEDASRKSKIDNPAYRKQVRDFIFTMDSTIRVTDPYRLSSLAIHGGNDYDRSGITEIPQMVSVNQYPGWYSGSFSGLGRYLDSRNKNYPNQVLFISEYGAGGDVRINSTKPQRFDFTGKYQREYHKSYLKQISEREFLVGGAIWNQFDFSQPHTGGSIYHINQKGMQKFDRTPKDVYYLYKSNWNPEPMVYIASRDWSKRSGWSGKTRHDILLNTQEVDVYSNLNEVELFINGTSIGIKKPDDLMETTWEVPFKEGVNSIRAIAKKGDEVVEDFLKIQFTNYNLEFDPSDVLAINVGFNGEFEEKSGFVWLPDQKYFKNHYGAVDGKPRMVNKDVILKDTKGTEPLFNYYMDGLSAYNIDIPDGTYIVKLYFADGETIEKGKRIFDVSINGKIVLKNLDLFDQFGFGHAIEKAFVVEVNNEKGINIKFKALKGKALLNAIQLRKIN